MISEKAGQAVASDHSEIPLGRGIALLRERAGISQAELARRTGQSPAVVSRIESGERFLTPPELTALVEALATDDAHAFLEYYGQHWSELPRPLFEQRDRDVLWTIEQALRQLRDVYATPDLKHVFERQLRAYE